MTTTPNTVVAIDSKPNAPLARVEPSEIESSIRVESLIRIALEKGINPTELYAIMREERVEQSRAAFNSAYVEFQRTCGPVLRKTIDANPKMSRVNRAGQTTKRQYAGIDDIALVVDDPLRRLGFGYDFSGPTATPPDGMVAVNFVLRHCGGWESVTPSSPIPAEGSSIWRTMAGTRDTGGMSPQQAVVAAEAYARRTAMLKGLGVITAYEDSDYAMNRAPVLSAEQLETVKQLCAETKTDPAKGLLLFAAAETLETIKQTRYDAVVKMLEIKRKALPQ